MAQKTTKTAEPVTIENYRQNMLLCRLYGHRWPNPDRFHWTRITGYGGRVISYRMTMQCTRCPKMGTDVIDARTGQKYPRRYNDPDGYKLLGVERSDMWLEHVHRATERVSDIEEIALDDLLAEQPAEAAS